MIFYVEFTKKLILFSLFTPRFFIGNKRLKRRGTFFKRGGNSLKRTYVEGGICKMNRNKQRRERGSKTGSFRQRYFLNDPPPQMFDYVLKRPLLPVKKKETNYYTILNFKKMLPYVCFPFLRWLKFCSGCFRQVFFHLGDKKSGCWSR